MEGSRGWEGEYHFVKDRGVNSPMPVHFSILEMYSISSPPVLVDLTAVVVPLELMSSWTVIGSDNLYDWLNLLDNRGRPSHA